MQLELFKTKTFKNPINVATVPMRSPFRYPGGKTWFIPYAREWLKQYNRTISLIEPFAGGGIIGLTAAFENLVPDVTFVEKDEDIASVWRTMLSSQANWLAEQVINFDVTPENVEEVLSHSPKSVRERAFCTILRNRLQHGGILAPGAGLVKNGENGKGMKSRWYPETICKRILRIAKIRNKIKFIQGDGLDVMREESDSLNVAFFIDPPYTKAGRRLYLHHQIDHENLFAIASKVHGDVLMTYDDAPEIQSLASSYGFESERVLMKTTHHLQKYELVIGRALSWLRTLLV
jgi:DNA adenine methylase